MDIGIAVLRWLLYVDLMLLFGVPSFLPARGARRSREAAEPPCWPRLAIAGAVLGVALSVGHLVVAGWVMSGVDRFGAVPVRVYWTILTRMPMGEAFEWRVGALTILALGCAIGRLLNAPVGRTLVMLSGAVALGTLAWNGHGTMHDGWRGWIHVAADITHLLAAGAWLGALAVLTTLAFAAQRRRAEASAQLAASARQFAPVGTMIVSALGVSGLANYLFIAGWTTRPLFTTAYGQLLSIKLGLFAVMLSIAGINRYALVPRLEHETAAQDGTATRRLGISVRVEALVALVVIAVVALLGTLSADSV